jgi:NAD(P)H dehydrogenase (quinone)
MARFGRAGFQPASAPSPGGGRPAGRWFAAGLPAGWKTRAPELGRVDRPGAAPFLTGKLFYQDLTSAPLDSTSLPAGVRFGRASGRGRTTLRILILFVHPRPESFCAKLLGVTRARLEADGHQVEVADLYAEGFNPAMIAEDFAQFAGAPMPDDVLREQARVDRNEAMIVIAPVWWWQYPAMLKGWIDRVFIEGWAFTDSRDPNTAPILSIGKVLVLATAGAEPSRFAKYGYLEGIRTTWDVGVWGYCGVDVQTSILWAIRPDGMSQADVAARLAEGEAVVAAFAGRAETETAS